MDSIGILKKKGLFSELEIILYELTEINHNGIQKAFFTKGWENEKRILPEMAWTWDAYKDRVVVSVEFSLIDAVHRDFFRLLMWHYDDKADAVIYITTTFQEPKFLNVKRDIEICQNNYPDLLPIPILLIGLD
jgi:hypothetical protein